MQRIRAFSLAALSIVACFAVFPIAGASAGNELLDPGWQIAYTPPSSYGGGGGLFASMFDGAGQPVIAYQPAPMYYPPVPRAYQPAPVYYQQMSMPQPRAYQPAPVYYQQMPMTQPRAYQPAPVYYQSAPQPRAYQPAPVSYQQVPILQPRGYQPVPMSYQQMPAQQQRVAYQPAPVNYQQTPAAQARANQQTAPQYTGSALPPPSAPAPAPTPRRSVFQLAPPRQRPAIQPAPQAAFQPALPPAAQEPAPPEQAPPAPHRSFFQLTPPPLPPVSYAAPTPAYAPSGYGDPAQTAVDPKYNRQLVDYQGNEKPGTIVIDTPNYFLYLVMEGGKAMRYGIGVGRPGFTWAGVKEISSMREWPDWYPPAEMLQRRPDLPRYMPGGPENPLGARALYLGSTLYRIHGSNEPWTIGTPVSSGCIRLRNADIIDLYARVKVGTRVIVI